MFKPPLDLRRARILVVNDDGIRARGLKALERIAKSLSDDVWIFAPEEEQSGAAHSLSLTKAIRVNHLGARRYSVGGSPTDCVLIAINRYLADRPPDLVLSGINRGENLGDDVTYSGTVAGAMEATLLGVPAIALSQQVLGNTAQYRTAETLAPDIIRKLLACVWPRDVFMNVNFPDLKAEEVRGVSIVAQGRQKAGYRLHDIPNPRRDGNYFVIGNAIKGKQVGRRDTDYRASERGEISITPLHCDLTHMGALKSLRVHFK